MPIDLTAYPKKMKLRWRWDGDDGTFITYQNPVTGAISILNPVGAMIFAQSDGNHTVHQIVAEIVKAFEAPDVEQVTKDVAQFLEFLSQIGAVRMLDDLSPNG